MDALAHQVAERGVDRALALEAAHAGEGSASISTVKWLSPLPSSPAWPRCFALSLITASRVGASAARRRCSISVGDGSG